MSAAAVAAPPQTLTKRGVGASSAGAAIDCSDYRGPIDAWLEITGRSKGFEGNKATEWGLRFEPAIRKAYVDKHQVTVHVPPVSLFHRELPYVRATPDGIVVDAAGAWLWVGPQCKNIGWRMAPLWDDGATPQDYLIQGVVEMSVTNLDRIDFFVVIGGQDDREVTIWRDAELEADVLGALQAFWGYVERDEQPPITGSKRFRSHLLSQIKKKAVVEATPSDLRTLERWRAIAVEQKQLKAEERLLKNLVLHELVQRGGNKLNSEIGAISVGNPSRKTAWKAVAEEMKPAMRVLELIDGELAAMTEAFDDDRERPGLPSAFERLRASVALVAGGDSYETVVARNTKVGDPSFRRPNAWTKSEEDEENDND